MKKRSFMEKSLSLALSSVMVLSLLSGCSGGSGDKGNTTTNKEQSTAKEVAGTYPIVTKPLTLKMWATLRKAEAFMTDFNQKTCFQEMEKATGIHIEFIHPPSSKTKEQFDMMVASNDLPDMIWKNPVEAIDNKFLLPLNDLVDKNAPNYKKILDKYPNFKKAMYTDDGTLTGFGYLVPTLEQNIITGPMLRMDWLEKLGLKVPQTIDEWETVLTAFKEKDPNGNGKADEIPFDDKSNSFMYFAMAWGVKNDYFISGGAEKGTIKYGPIEPGFKEYLTKMSDWYKKGLINKEYETASQKKMDENFTSGRSGATIGGSGAYLGNLTTLMKEDPDFLLWPAPFPKLNANGKIYLDLARGWTLSNRDVGYITTSCKYPVEAVRWFDWGYSKEGQMAFNYGKEGVSYKMVNGVPTFTDEVKNKPNGSAAHVMSSDEHAFAVMPELSMQGSVPAQMQARKEWAKGVEAPDANLYLPPLSYTKAESDADKKFADIKKYVDKTVNDFITGREPLSNYDAFVKQVKNMGIEDCIKIRQDALERWKKRGGVPYDPNFERVKTPLKDPNLGKEKGYKYLDADLK